MCLSERGRTAYQPCSLSSACTRHTIKRGLRVTKPLNALDVVTDTRAKGRGGRQNTNTTVC